jgi:nitrate reductase NapD
MNISSVVVRTRPERAAAVRARLAELPGIEIHAATPEGRLVATIEDTTTALAADTFVRLHDVEGVLSVAMVYQYSDESPVEEAQA